MGWHSVRLYGPKNEGSVLFRYLVQIMNTKQLQFSLESLFPPKYYLLKIGLHPSSYDKRGAQIENNQWGIKNVTRRRADSRVTWREAYRVSLHIPAGRSNCTQKLFGRTTRMCSLRTVECPWYLTSVLSYSTVFVESGLMVEDKTVCDAFMPVVNLLKLIWPKLRAIEWCYYTLGTKQIYYYYYYYNVMFQVKSTDVFLHVWREWHIKLLYRSWFSIFSLKVH
jgi:hypothetical protein